MEAKQFGFGDYEQSTAKKRTMCERCLAEMEAVVPWKALIDLIEPLPPQEQQQGWQASLPARNDAEDLSAAAVVRHHRSGDG
jgi:transposase, IS5 family